MAYNPKQSIDLPPSKSMAARYLVATYFAGSLPIDPDFDGNDDLQVLQEALQNIYTDEEPIDYGASPIDLHASGTALRFVTAVCASSPEADFVITGVPRLMERPMDPLIGVLKEAGADIIPQGENGKGPYRITGKKLKGGEFSIRGDLSSQFISALMLVAPSWDRGMKLNFTTPLVSKPYIEMTAKVMEKFGIKVNLTDSFVEVPHEEFKAPEKMNIEADWSSAAFFYEASLLSGNSFSIKDLYPPKDSLQGDSHCADLFKELGLNSDFNDEGVYIKPNESSVKELKADMRNYPDMVPALAVGCMAKDIKFSLSGVRNLRDKESNRIEALRVEASKLGFKLQEEEDEISWNGEWEEKDSYEIIETYGDHRIAMAFAMAAFRFSPLKIRNPEVVEKSFPFYWEQLPKTGLNVVFDKDEVLISKK